MKLIKDLQMIITRFNNDFTIYRDKSMRNFYKKSRYFIILLDKVIIL